MPILVDLNIIQWFQGLNWNTAKRAHAAVLTEIERVHVSWSDQVGVDITRQRFTHRALKTQTTTNAEEQVKICNCNQARDHSEGKVLYKPVCYTCYKAMKRHYPHRESKCDRAKKHARQLTDKQRV